MHLHSSFWFSNQTHVDDESPFSFQTYSEKNETNKRWNGEWSKKTETDIISIGGKSSEILRCSVLVDNMEFGEKGIGRQLGWNNMNKRNAKWICISPDLLDEIYDIFAIYLIKF